MVGFFFKKKNIIKTQIVILFLFLYPRGNDYREYFLLLIFFSLIMFFSKKIEISKKYVVLPIMLFVFVLFSTLVRFFFLEANSFDDFTEIGRLFLPVYMIVMSNHFKQFRVKDLVDVLSIVVLIDFLIALLEFFYQKTSGMSIYLFLKNNYWSPTHWVSPYRSKGLFPGPGQHAIAGVFIFTVLLGYYLFGTRAKTVKNLVVVVMSFITILLSLSRTGLVCLILSFFSLMLTYFNRSSFKSKPRVILVMLCVLGIVGYFMMDNVDKFSRTFLVFKEGIQNNSFKARQDNWQDFEIAFNEQPEYLLIGWGKSFFGEVANQTDNEYVFIFFFYGLIFFLVFFLNVMSFFIKSLFVKNKTTEHLILTVSVFVGFIFAIPSVYFFYVPNLFLFTILGIILINNKKKEKTNILTEI